MAMRNQYAGLFLLALLSLAGCSPSSTEGKRGANADDAELVAEGKQVYEQNCAVCHGVNLEGQANWRKRLANGRLPAPPHDETGHTWHHPDQVLFSIVKYGLVPPNVPEGYETDMPAWGGSLSDRQIWSVLAYIKSRWPDQARRTQDEINQEAIKRSQR